MKSQVSWIASGLLDAMRRLYRDIAAQTIREVPNVSSADGAGNPRAWPLQSRPLSQNLSPPWRFFRAMAVASRAPTRRVLDTLLGVAVACPLAFFSIGNAEMAFDVKAIPALRDIVHGALADQDFNGEITPEELEKTADQVAVPEASTHYLETTLRSFAADIRTAGDKSVRYMAPAFYARFSAVSLLAKRMAVAADALGEPNGDLTGDEFLETAPKFLNLNDPMVKRAAAEVATVLGLDISKLLKTPIGSASSACRR